MPPLRGSRASVSSPAPWSLKSRSEGRAETRRAQNLRDGARRFAPCCRPEAPRRFGVAMNHPKASQVVQRDTPLLRSTISVGPETGMNTALRWLRPRRAGVRRPSIGAGPFLGAPGFGWWDVRHVRVGRCAGASRDPGLAHVSVVARRAASILSRNRRPPHLSLPDAGQSEPDKAHRSYQTVVLENEYLRITFLPELGGKIHEVIEKATAIRYST